jgi:hypothetical protein
VPADSPHRPRILARNAQHDCSGDEQWEAFADLLMRCSFPPLDTLSNVLRDAERHFMYIDYLFESVDDPVGAVSIDEDVIRHLWTDVMTKLSRGNVGILLAHQDTGPFLGLSCNDLLTTLHELRNIVRRVQSVVDRTRALRSESAPEPGPDNGDFDGGPDSEVSVIHA